MCSGQWAVALLGNPGEGDKLWWGVSSPPTMMKTSVFSTSNGQSEILQTQKLRKTQTRIQSVVSGRYNLLRFGTGTQLKFKPKFNFKVKKRDKSRKRP